MRLYSPTLLSHSEYPQILAHQDFQGCGGGEGGGLSNHKPLVAFYLSRQWKNHIKRQSSTFQSTPLGEALRLYENRIH